MAAALKYFPYRNQRRSRSLYGCYRTDTSGKGFHTPDVGSEVPEVTEWGALSLGNPSRAGYDAPVSHPAAYSGWTLV